MNYTNPLEGYGTQDRQPQPYGSGSSGTGSAPNNTPSWGGGGKSGNPFADVLNHVQGFNDALRRAQGKNAFAPGVTQDGGQPQYFSPNFAPGVTQDGGQPQYFAPNMAPGVMSYAAAQTEGPGTPDNRDTGNGGTGGPTTTPTQPPTTTTPVTTAPPPQPFIPHTGGPDYVAPANHAQSFIQTWAQQPGYEWLASSPQGAAVAQAYFDYVAQHGGLGENGDVSKGGIDFPDFLQHYILSHESLAQSGAGNPLYKRSGNDTYGVDPANGQNPNNPDTGNPTIFQGYGTPANPNLNQPPPGGAPVTTTPTTPTGTPAPPANNTPLPGGGASTPGVTQDTGQPQYTTLTGTPDPNNPNGDVPDEIQTLIDKFQKDAKNNQPDIESLMNPMFARQRQLLQQQMQAQAALTPGRSQSGGFGQNEGQALADLSGQQSSRLADAEQQMSLAQMQQNTQLIQLGTQAGMQKYVTDINADLQKYQINTNNDLQRWLDSQDNALKRYGIDTNDVLQRYQAELQLKGQTYSADRGVDAAALHAAAAQAAAAAASQASTYNANLQYQLGIGGLNVNREQNIGQFILGLLGLGNMNMDEINKILTGLPGGNVVVKP